MLNAQACEQKLVGSLDTRLAENYSCDDSRVDSNRYSIMSRRVSQWYILSWADVWVLHVTRMFPLTQLSL